MEPSSLGLLESLLSLLSLESLGLGSVLVWLSELLLLLVVFPVLTWLLIAPEASFLRSCALSLSKSWLPSSSLSLRTFSAASLSCSEAVLSSLTFVALSTA